MSHVDVSVNLCFQFVVWFHLFWTDY